MSEFEITEESLSDYHVKYLARRKTYRDEYIANPTKALFDVNSTNYSRRVEAQQVIDNLKL